MNKQFIKSIFSSLLFFLILLLSASNLQAQHKPPVVQFSGIVLAAEDSSSVLPGVHVYVPKAGRGTSTNALGFFSLPVLVGDSVVISAVGYQKQYYKIPNDKGDQITIIVEMSEDTTYLPEIAVFPYPTEEMFKRALLAMELPDQENRDFMAENLNPDLLALMLKNTPMDGSENFKMYQQQQFQQMHNRYFIPTNPFFNPLNWANFIKSIKRGDFKKD